jgi:4-hydroxybenzoate polyprenyltransferase
VLALAAFGLVLTTNAVTIVWSVVALAIAIVYPFSKRFLSMPQAVLGVAFSFGIPMAFAAVQGDGPFSLGAMVASVPPLAWVLLLGNLFWVLAYDTEYAMVDRDDDLRIGIKTSAITLGRLDVVAILLFYATYLAIWGAVILGRTTAPLPMVLGLVAAALQAAWHGWLIRDRSRDGCFKAFRLNHWLGFAVFAGIAGAYSLA